jgi:vitamin B12 transporter
MGPMGRLYVIPKTLLIAVISVCSLQSLQALPAGNASISGRIVDPLGDAIPGASVELVRNGERQPVSERTGDGQGTFSFTDVAPGRYELIARANGFESRTSQPVFVSANDRLTVEIALPLGPLQQALTVTAAATELPTSRSGAAVTVIDSHTLDALAVPEITESLRIVPGANIGQTGQRGGLTSLFIRGGASNFAKVLVDGVPANDIGGNFDFSTLSTAGIDRVEVLRQSNSVLYGSDALSGVINITTRRGRSLIPELSYGIDGGNLGTLHQDVSFGGAFKRFDYFSDYSHFRTDNNLPNNKYRNGTYAGRFGVALGKSTDVSATVRRIDTNYGSPNAFDYYGIADDSTHKQDITFVGVAAQSQIAPRLQTIVRFASINQNLHDENPTPTGESFDPFGFGANYLGKALTIQGANGYSATGQAILDYGGTYPSIYLANTKRQTVMGQVNYQLSPSFDLSGAGRVEHESGFTDSSGSRSTTDRTNGGGFIEAQGRFLDRIYANAGLGIEHNALFGNVVTPRLSVAAYLHTASAAASSSATALGDTKLTVNAGKGIKASTIYQEQSSLYKFVQAVPASTRPHVDPIGAERARSFDVGIEQGFWRNHARVRAAWFDNQFSDLIEYVSKSALIQLGVPQDVVAAAAFGAYVNSSSYRARGLETSGEIAISRVRVSAGYMRLDAVVNKSFSSSALAPAINPSIPGIPIGAYGPLVGARPFRRPENSGNVMVSYTDGPLLLALAGYFSGKQDDSTFLSDGFFGNSLLLPNKDLDAAYQKFDLTAAYRIHPRLRWYLSIENVGDQRYEAAAGFPALPRTFRTGVTVNVGGDRMP